MQELKNRMKLMCEIRERELIRKQVDSNTIAAEKGLAGMSNEVVSFVEGSSNREIVKAINVLLKSGNRAFFDTVGIIPYQPKHSSYRQEIQDTIDLVNLRAIARLHDAVKLTDFSEERMMALLQDDLADANI